MGDVIGYKGTSDARLLAWSTMLLLRKSLRWAKTRGITIPHEEKWLEEEFNNYRKAA